FTSTQLVNGINLLLGEGKAQPLFSPTAFRRSARGICIFPAFSPFCLMMVGLITFEGGDGSGKSTQIRALENYLKQAGRPCLTTREPGGTGLGVLIRKVLLEVGAYQIAPATELFLYLADRAQHVHEIILPALGAGKIVLCDRFTDSTLAYQGYGRGLDLEGLRRLNDIAGGAARSDFFARLPGRVRAGAHGAAPRANSGGRRRSLRARGNRVSRASARRLSRAGALSRDRCEPVRGQRCGGHPAHHRSGSALMSFADIIGHQKQLALLRAGLTSGRLHHAYLFTGPEGIGKRTVATALAKAIHCERRSGDFCGECVNCSRIADGNHPDVRIVEPLSDKKEIGIPQIREIEREINL